MLTSIYQCRSRHPFAKVGLLLVLLMGIILPPFSSIAQDDDSNRLIAAFLLKFSKFAEIPGTNDRTLHFLVMANSMAANTLQKLVELEQKDHGTSYRVSQVEKLTEPLEDSDILFIDKSLAEECSTILERISSKPILTVSNCEGFAKKGGIIELYKSGNRYRFRINHSLSKEKGIELDSRLLRLASRVY